VIVATPEGYRAAKMNMATPVVMPSYFINLVGDGAAATYAKLYRTNPWLNAGIRTIAWGMARSPLQVYVREDDGQRSAVRWTDKTRGRNSTAQRIDKGLNTPSSRAPRIGPQRRMRRTMVDYLVYTNAIWEIEPDGTLTHIPWKQIKPLQAADESIIGYMMTTLHETRYLVPEQVIHFCSDDDPDSPVGAPPIGALTHTLALHDAIQRHLTSFYGNAARPSANLKLSPQAKKEDMEYVQGVMRDLYQSPENAGKVVVTTGDFQPITSGTDQSQLVELAKLSREEIAGVLRIPGPVLGFLENAIKSNVKELREQYIRDVIGNWAPSIEDDIWTQLLYPMGYTARDIFTEFDLDKHLRPDMEGLATVSSTMVNTATLNERRRWFNLKDLPYPEADTLPTTPGAAFLGIEGSTGTNPGGDGEEQITEPHDPDKAPKPPRPEEQPKPRDGDLDGILSEPK